MSNEINTVSEPQAREYLVSPKPSVRLACGNCGSKKIFKRTDLDLGLEVAECEDCSRLFAICPHCQIPSGLEVKEMSGARFWKCPQCEINFTLLANSNTFLDKWGQEPAANNYPYGNPEEHYDTKGGVSMEGLDDSILEVPVGYITKADEPNIAPLAVTEETPAPKKRGRKAKTQIEE